MGEKYHLHMIYSFAMIFQEKFDFIKDNWNIHGQN